MFNLEPFTFSNDHINDQLIHHTMDHVSEAIMYTDAQHKIIYVNNSFQQITGYHFEDIVGKTPLDLKEDIQAFSLYEEKRPIIEADGYWQGEICQRSNSGEIYVQSLRIIANKDEAGQIKNHIIIYSDLIDNELVLSASYYDPLTSLPNRLLFEKQIISAVNQTNAASREVVIVFFQLEGFTDINEKYGFLFGDMILKHIAARLKQNHYKNAMITRWEGTEFAYLFEKVQAIEEIETHIQAIQTKISAPIIINGMEVSLLAKFGVAICDEQTITASELLSKAKTALQVAKETEETIVLYEEQMGKEDNLFIMELELKQAIKDNQFELYYQPLICVNQNKLIGFEGLIRWNHPTKGLISPIKFIPLAEKTGLIQEIGAIVFEEACQQIKEWRKAAFEFGKIHVNLSMNQFNNNDLVEQFRVIMEKTGVNPSDIGIELTESSITLNMEDTIKKLNDLKSLGLSIAIDDFGTGFSSFGYLIDFPVQRIKIDRSFMKALGENNKIKAIVTAIAAMGKTMGLEVVAEGIETEEQLLQVQELKCTVAQGYLFDRPLPTDKVEEKWLMKE